MKPCNNAGVMDNSAQVKWDDVRFILSVIDQGSVAAAARDLGVNHATILRRIADFEARTGVRMFDKTTRGYQISPDRRGIVEAMREANSALAGVERLMENERPQLSNGLRLTTTDTLAQFILAPILKEYALIAETPVEMQVDNAHLDLSRMQAHLTVRPSPQLPPELDGVMAGAIHFAAYATSKTQDAPWIGLSGPLSRSLAAKWTRNQKQQAPCFGDAFPAIAAMAATGQGRAVLPSYVGDATPGLIRLSPDPEIAAVPVWVAAHKDFARSGRIRRAQEFFVNALGDLSALQTPK